MQLISRRFDVLPTTDDIDLLLLEIPIFWQDNVLREPGAVLNSLSWDFALRPIGKQGTTIRSMLIPRTTGGFCVIVNSWHRPDSAHVQWLIAHEVAHALFFVGGSDPHRYFAWSEAEEAFCDEFANRVARLGAAQRLATPA